jgi:uncharacterized protein YdaU (DUF1376 family)
MATYEPKYLYWYEKDFASDAYVSRVMRSLDRHFYRALIIASCFNSLRPYLPNDDSQLWILADAESLEQWMEHKAVVMHKFTLTADRKYWQHKRILADWQLMIDAHEKYVNAGKLGGKQKASNAKATVGDALATVSDALAPSTTTTVLDFDSTKQHHTHTQQDGARVCLFSYDQVAKYLDAEMLGPKKSGEKEQIDDLIATHGGLKFLAATHEYWSKQNPERFSRTIYRWTALLENFTGWLQQITPGILQHLEDDIWCKENPEESKRIQEASIERQTQESIARRDRPCPSAIAEVDAIDIFGSETEDVTGIA